MSDTDKPRRTANELLADLAAVMRGVADGSITPKEANARTRAANAEMALVEAELRKGAKGLRPDLTPRDKRETSRR